LVAKPKECYFDWCYSALGLACIPDPRPLGLAAMPDPSGLGLEGDVIPNKLEFDLARTWVLLLKKLLFLLEKNHRFDLKSKIKNYMNLSQTCLILLFSLLLINVKKIIIIEKKSWISFEG